MFYFIHSFMHPLYTGNVEDGFEFRPGNTFQLLFTIPRQKEATTIKNAELWLFPSLQYQQSFPEDTIVEMKLIVKVNLAHAKQPRESPMKMTWDTRVDCIPLKMTVLSKKISNNLRKNNLEEANITVTIEVLQTVSQRPFPTDHVNMTSSNIDICDGLAERRTNTPFLVVKYYSDEVYNAYMSSGYSLGMQPVPDSKTKRDLLPVLRDSAGHSNCSIVPLVADLTEIYGSFIIKPRRLDISDCHGSCNSLSNSNSFTQHATIVDKLKLKKGGDFIRDICCVPVAYKSQRLLIFQSHYFVLVEFKDMIVTECACH